MAARIRKAHTADSRQKIQSSQLINFLQNHALNGTDVKKSQITAALGLLKKTLPDLQAIEGNMNLNVRQEDALAELE